MREVGNWGNTHLVRPTDAQNKRRHVIYVACREDGCRDDGGKVGDGAQWEHLVGGVVWLSRLS